MDAERRRAQTRETPAEAADRRRRERKRMRRSRSPKAPAVPVHQFEPPPRRFRIDPRTLMPVYEDEDPMARARRLMGLP